MVRTSCIVGKKRNNYYISFQHGYLPNKFKLTIKMRDNLFPSLLKKRMANFASLNNLTGAFYTAKKKNNNSKNCD